jgi:hypothetical protein
MSGSDESENSRLSILAWKLRSMQTLTETALLGRLRGAGEREEVGVKPAPKKKKSAKAGK